MARWLVLSDIHANLTALEAVLQAAGTCERVVCLGDLVGYGPDPNEVVDRLRALGAVCIRGNHDRVASGLATAEDFSPAARVAIEWTRRILREDTLAYLRGLPAGPQQLDGVVLVHGAVTDEDLYVYSPWQAAEQIQRSPGLITLFGHTHLQGGFQWRAGRIGLISLPTTAGQPVAEVVFDDAARYLLNPGSVGQPRDGDPRAAFAVLEDGRGVEFWRVAYDIRAVQARMAAAGLPESLILRLSFGR